MIKLILFGVLVANVEFIASTHSSASASASSSSHSENNSKCGLNERYVECPDGVCAPKKCSELGYPIPCPDPLPGQGCPGKPGCICIEGYLRDKNGLCIPKKQCPSCRGDPNAIAGCDLYCNRRCSNYNAPPEPCKKICYANGCECKEGFVYDDAKDRCVLPRDCTPICKKNEVYSNCTNGGCFGARDCCDKGAPIKCVKIDPKYCKKGCICKDKYLRNDHGDCVHEDECDDTPIICKKNEVYSNCTNGGCFGARDCCDKGAPVKCYKIDPKDCIKGCICKDKYLRNDHGDCVHEDECDDTPIICKNNEVYSNCTNGGCFGARDCCDKGAPVKCYKIDPKDCIKGCICKDKYLRNDHGDCVHEDECDDTPIICKKNEVYSNCTNGGCFGARDCCDKGAPVKCYKIDPKDCIKGCICKDKYLRNDHGDCVHEDECDDTPIICKKNEVYSNCTNGGCFGARDCCDKGAPVKCYKIDPKDCIKGCICKDKYLRNDHGDCVHEDECDDTPIICKKNEVYSNCTNGGCFGARDCCDKGAPVKCYKIDPKDCIKGCVCKDKYLRNDHGDCVHEDECDDTPIICKKNEVYSNCTNGGCFGARDCCDKGAPVKCYKIDPKDCIKGCVCKDKYLRNDHGDCVHEDECDNKPTCPKNEVYDSCVNGGCYSARNCSQYGNPEICVDPLKCISGCLCKEGYLRNDKTGKCVPLNECPGKQCKKNERYEKCPGSLCRPQTCKELGYPVPCPYVGPDDHCLGSPTCVCIDGYLRNDKGDCIPEKQCPACGGDIHAESGCGVNCGRLCSNYKKENVVCPLICKLNGCDCKKGYVYDSNKHRCVRPEDCTPICPKNEVWDSCANGGCYSARNCSQYGNPEICVRPKICKGGCLCQDGYLRNDKTGHCVPIKECPGICGKKEVYDPCLPICPPQECGVNPALILCLPNPEPGSPDCKAGCKCVDGYVRNPEKECVLPEQCPICNKPNEQYDPCIVDCPPRTCDSLRPNATYHCPIRPAVCKGGCQCKPGYYRNKLGECISKANCKKCLGPHEYYSCGGACDNVCDLLDEQSQDNCPIVNVKCNEMCYCEKGYARDKDGICILIEKCPPRKCPKNEVWNSCANGGCYSARNCSQYGNPTICVDPLKCKGGCLCKEGYLRNDKTGHCVPIKECPARCNKPNEQYDPCIVDCPPRTCESLRPNATYHCPIKPAVCRGGCQCKPGYYRNKLGDCISKENCEKCLGPHEYYSCGGACDNVCELLEEQSQDNCPIVNVKCNEMCYCDKGYARDYDGICIPIKKCPPRKCPKNEVWNTCANGGCYSARNCSQYGNPEICVHPKECKGGCLCKEGYLRNGKTGLCVPIDKCPARCNKPNEQYDSCIVDCPPRTCDSLRPNATYHCPIKPAVCKGGCQCKPGYYRNKLGDCISKENCEKCLGPHEYYSCGGACDNVCELLEEQSQDNCPIVNVKCNEMCYCEKGYARDYDGICIPIKKCPPRKCPKNEVWNTCANGGCYSARNCSQYGNLEICVDPKECKGGCLCKEGYLRNDKTGLCVPIDECPARCNKPNEQYDSCIVDCPPRTCDSLRPNATYHCPIKPAVCKGGCQCKPGYYRNKLGDCISKENCEKCLGPHEYYSCGGACDNVCELLEEQSQDNCPIVNIKCNEMCYCDKGYARDYDGICIPIKKCPPRKCPKNEVWNTCANGGCYSARNCSQYGNLEICVDPKECKGGCLCKEGYLRNDKTGLCVPIDECPARCNKPNEQYDSCIDNCPPRTCDSLRPNATYHCPIGPAVCRGGCQCKPGYYRNKLGDCISKENCEKCLGPHEYYSCGGACDNVCELLDVQSQDNCPIVNIKCNEMCYCDKGYARNKDGVCIPIEKCPPNKCGKNEEYSTCVQGVCRNQYCSEVGTPVACPDIIEEYCETGCVCKENYYRDCYGNCVHENECPTLTCGKNEEYSTCVQGVCRNQYCSEVGTPVLCPDLREETCETGCVCKENYYRDRKGNCIPEKQCPTECKGDPNARPGCGINCGRLCSNYKKANETSCAQVCYEDGCNCIKGTVLDTNTGKCVPPEHCTPTCKANERYSNCIQGECRPLNCEDKGKNLPCPRVKPEHCKKGCVCVEGYLKNAKGHCVKEHDCPQICGKNEEYSKCIQAVCRHQYCSKVGTPLACPAIAEGGCETGCVCKKGYYRDRKGNCIPEKECPTECKGDPNARPGCGINCGRLCSNYKRANETVCIQICYEDGCDCIKGTVLDTNTGKCVPPEQCTPTCKANEKYSTCIQGECRPLNCDDKGKDVPCPKIKPEHCKKGCICAKGYLKNAKGDCVKEADCPPKCGENENYNTCTPKKCDAEYCPKTRDSPQSCVSTKECGPPRCMCNFNHKRDWKTKKCIPIEHCPPFKCDGPNEVYKSCPSTCPENCTNYLNGPKCPNPLYRIGIVVPCAPKCRCKDGYWRNSKQICVKAKDCEEDEHPCDDDSDDHSPHHEDSGDNNEDSGDNHEDNIPVYIANSDEDQQHDSAGQADNSNDDVNDN